jgi:class 3 adenylate cyclase
MRGLRIKVGIATGEVMDYISPATARIMYRGRVMNWAARISHLASAGQVGP